MKKLTCLILSLCLFVSITFGGETLDEYFENAPLVRQNFIVQKESRLGYLIPSALCSGTAYWLWSESDKPKNEQHQLGIRIMSGSFAFISLLFFGWALTPKKTFLFPKLDEDGKIWFEKQVEW